MKTLLAAIMMGILAIAPVSAKERAVENSVGMRMVQVPAGEFLMGTPFDDASRMADELPHKVKLTRPFRISTTEVTQRQWKLIMDSTPSKFAGDDLPVEMVSWKDATEFCRRLSAKEKKTYRLPTEAEWEYACRAKSKRLPAVDAVAWHANNSERATHSVGNLGANPWGIHDMQGNVAEWCNDFYGPYADAAVAKDPSGATEGTQRVIRGGSWLHFAAACRPSARLSAPESYQLPHVGFRVVQESPF